MKCPKCGSEMVKLFVGNNVYRCPQCQWHETEDKLGARPAWIEAAAQEIQDYPRWRESESCVCAEIIERHWRGGDV